MSDAVNHEIPLDAIAEEFLGQLRRREHPSISEYIARYPQLAADIGDVFPTLVTLEQARRSLDENLSPRSAESPDGTGGAGLERIGDYRILREAGRGGMGIVYEAEQESLGRRVAVKVLPMRALLDPRQLQRFQAEARAAGRLHHTNIVPVFGVGEHEGLHYYVMQLIDGTGLDRVLASIAMERKGSPSQANAKVVPAAPDAAYPAKVPPSLSSTGSAYWHGVALLGIQVADALAYAYRQGVMHRDIKPSNLLLDTQGTIWVTDFGLAKVTEGVDLTQTGDLVGTLRYLAPERLQGRFDHRSDLYSLGLSLYEATTLRPAFRDSDRASLVEQIAHADPPAPRRVDPQIPRDLETIILKAIAKEPASRYRSAEEMADDLRRFLADRPIQARRSRLLERTWRWCRRNPIPTTLMVALALTFSLGLAGISWKWREALHAQREAESAQIREREARLEADRNAAKIRQGIEDLKTAQANLDWGQAHAAKWDWDTAHAKYSEAIRLRPENIDARKKRGELYASLGLWADALEDYQAIFAIQEPDTSYEWMRFAVLLRYAGERSAYHDLCRRMSARFQGTRYHEFARELVRATLMDPEPGANLRRLLEIARDAETFAPRDWYEKYLLGTALYRMGEFDKAKATLNDSLTANPEWAVRAISCPVLAMSLYRLGDVDGARAELKRSAETLDAWEAQRDAPYGEANWIINWNVTPSWPIGWWDWLEAQHYHAEAEALILATRPPSRDRDLLLRARATAALRRHEAANTYFAAAREARPADQQVLLESHRHRGYECGRKRDWANAYAAFRKATELRPDDSFSWRFMALTQLASGDVGGYRVSCNLAVQRFQQTLDSSVACNVVFMCLARKDALDDFQRLLPLGNVAAKRFQFGLRLQAGTYFRAGQYQDTLAKLRDYEQLFELEYLGLCFSALLHHELGDHVEAQRYLSQVEPWVRDVIFPEPFPIGESKASWGAWDDFIVCNELLKEVKSEARSNLKRNGAGK